MMKQIEEEWVCSTCSPEQIKSTPTTRKAVVLTCPECNKQRPYCGVDGSLAENKWKMGIERHLEHHELSEDVREKYRVEALMDKEIKDIPESICKEAREKGWDEYSIPP